MTDPNSFRTLIEKIQAEEEVYKVSLPVPMSYVSDVFSKKTMELHYGILYSNYVKNALAGEGEFQVAGAKLHTLFFEQFQRVISPNNPTGSAKILIEDKFESYQNFKSEFSESAMKIHGSGWCYLTLNGKIKTIPNHEILSDVAIIIDCWEHSYITDFGADKENYYKDVWKIINWDIVSARINNHV